jgi:hypothetical protein
MGARPRIVQIATCGDWEVIALASDGTLWSLDARILADEHEHERECQLWWRLPDLPAARARRQP